MRSHAGSPDLVARRAFQHKGEPGSCSFLTGDGNTGGRPSALFRIQF